MMKILFLLALLLDHLLTFQVDFLLVSTIILHTQTDSSWSALLYYTHKQTHTHTQYITLCLQLKQNHRFCSVATICMYA